MDLANLTTPRLLLFCPKLAIALSGRMSPRFGAQHRIRMFGTRGIIFAKTILSVMLAETRLAMCIAVAQKAMR